MTMDVTINAKELRASLPRIVERIQKGERFTVLYRSRPALRLVPVSDDTLASTPLGDDPLYRAQAVGASSDGLTSKDHDRILYGK
jgi:antitoxin (DNA-binding transcriptional repressor) of toxin-antitoxin stability system